MKQLPLFSALVVAGSLLGGCSSSSPEVEEILIAGPMPTATPVKIVGYEVVRGATTFDGVAAYTVVANCPDGKVVLSGGGSQGNYGWYVAGSRPSGDGKSWQVNYILDVVSGNTVGIGEAWAVCVSQVGTTAISDVEIIKGETQIDGATDDRPTRNGTGTLFVTASCPVGKHVLGGGATQSASSPRMYMDSTSPRPDGSGWQVQYIQAQNNTGGTGEAWAVCATLNDATQLGYEVIKSERGGDGNSVYTIKTDCPARTTALGGGSRNYGFYWFVDDVRPNSDGSGWQVQYAPSINGTNAAGDGEAWAICAALDTSPVAGDIGTISGVVTQSATGAVVSGAVIEIVDSVPLKQTVTAADGSYTIPKVTPGQYTVAVSKASYQNFSGDVTVADATPVSFDITLSPATTYSIGDTGPGGGVVFSVNTDRTGGLEASPVHLQYDWCSPRRKVTGIDAITDANVKDSHSGAYNTQKIVAECGLFSAAGAASTYKWPNGQTDGFLPNKDELFLLLSQNAITANYSPTDYWSSTGTRLSNSAWKVSYFPGEPAESGPSGQEDPYLLRAVRAF